MNNIINNLKRLINFVNNNKLVSLLFIILLFMLISVILSRNTVENNNFNNINELTYDTNDFKVTYLQDGTVIVQVNNPNLTDINTIKKTLNIPENANVIVDVPGAHSSIIEENSFKQIEYPDESLYDIDLSEVGN